MKIHARRYLLPVVVGIALLFAAVVVAYVIANQIKQGQELERIRTENQVIAQERTSYATDVIALRAQVASLGQTPAVGAPSSDALTTKGDPGIAGSPGPAGPRGDAGPPGPQGLSGAVGATGQQGPQGVKGDQGLTGATGPQGSAGAQGAEGPQGVQGEQGATGSAGAQGSPGATGPTGPPGPQGDTGEMPPTWSYTFAGITVNCVKDAGSSHYSCT